MLIVTVLFVVAGLSALIWMANWPFGTPGEKGLSDEQLRINAAHNRRHHRGVAQIMLPVLAVGFGITSIRILVDGKSGFAAAAMAVSSVVCVGIFVALIKNGRRRRSSNRR
ncbi:hypothetical protein ACGFIK_14615 [Micromonospora sp. NPDC048871]|uniref:hypothetical protein n=1 Tax=unclassified Micromonospora TaxID=2617518 RepID=UPI002E0D3590|nr:hypothetical protein OIE53_11055 [Micromonospora sp. NBC_01739]